jgi:hypothetical protein
MNAYRPKPEPVGKARVRRRAPSLQDAGCGHYVKVDRLSEPRRTRHVANKRPDVQAITNCCAVDVRECKLLACEPGEYLGMMWCTHVWWLVLALFIGLAHQVVELRGLLG